jgi:hypothetical protein
MSFQDDAAVDPLLKDLRLLQPLLPDGARAARVRARCRARLERTRPSERSATVRDVDGRLLTRLLVGSLCAVYVVDLIRIALRVYGVLE